MQTADSLPLDDPRRRRWEQSTEWPLLVAALAFLVAYAWPILDPDLVAPWPRVLTTVAGVAWLLFAVDYLARLLLSRHRAVFVRTNVFDLLVVVLPLLRPLRLLRLVTVLSVLNRRAGTSLRGRVIVYGVGGASLVILVAALALLDAERGVPGADVQTFGNAVWWAFATVTTVGYGDLVPLTSTGRVIATGLMLVGISLLGVVTATFASWLIERVEVADEDAPAGRQDSDPVTRADVEALTREVAELRAQLAAGGERPAQR